MRETIARMDGSDGRVLNVVITGGSTGIGRSMVDSFAAAGHRVFFSYLTSVSSAVSIENKWKNVTKARLDQGDVTSVAAFAAAVKVWAGPTGIDVLINNAALGSATVKRYVEGVGGEVVTNGHVPCVSKNHAHYEDTENVSSTKVSDDSVRRMMQQSSYDEALMRVNALGPLWVTEALLDTIMTAAKGENGRGRATIIFIGSVGGGSAAVFPEYCAADLMSKAAMTYLSKHLAAQHVRDAVDVVCLSPGATETEMFRESTLSKLDDVESFVDGMPKRRLIQPADVASTVIWLATSCPSGMFHGAVLDASMGLAVRPGLQTESKR